MIRPHAIPTVAKSHPEFVHWSKAFNTQNEDEINEKLVQLHNLRGRIMTHRYTKKQLVSFICDFLAHTEGAGAVCEARVAIANTAMALEIMRADKIQSKYDRDFKKFGHLLNLEED